MQGKTERSFSTTSPLGLAIPRVVGRSGQSLYADIVADFISQGAESMQVTIEGMKPATLRAGLRRALKGNEDVRLAQRGDETYLARHPTD